MTAAIDLAGVSVEFRRRHQDPLRALSDVDLRAEHGQVTCLLGPNGSGKTTLVNVLTGLLTSTTGQLDVLGLHPRHDRRELLKRVAVVPQETALYPELSARENLTFHASYYGMPRNQRAQRVAQALELVQLQQRADDRAGTFSGGMQRRLALGKALMMAPDLLLLDEPSLGVDVQSREAIWTRITQTAKEGRAVLLTTNYMEEAQRLGDRIVIIDSGHNVAAGTLADLTSVVPEPEHVAPARASLQDVFLHYTGRDLRD
ncbi:MAG: ABC transporter ATP-binding protein [Arachnia sp.]